MTKTLCEQLKPIAQQMATQKVQCFREEAAKARNNRDFRRANGFDRLAMSWSQLTVDGPQSK